MLEGPGVIQLYYHYHCFQEKLTDVIKANLNDIAAQSRIMKIPRERAAIGYNGFILRQDERTGKMLVIAADVKDKRKEDRHKHSTTYSFQNLVSPDQLDENSADTESILIKVSRT